MKETRLIFLEQSPGKKFEAKESQNPVKQENPKEDQAKKGIHDEYDDTFPFDEGETCNGTVCRIPIGTKPKAKTETVELGKEWEQTTIEDVDHVASQGDIVLVGAEWCSGCKKAKKELPKEYSSSKLLYINYDDNPDTIDQKFSLDGSLPGKFICEGSYNGETTYTKLS